MTIGCLDFGKSSNDSIGAILELMVCKARLRGVRICARIMQLVNVAVEVARSIVWGKVSVEDTGRENCRR
jgi:hypothetical protein